jgi:hypothetical protein
MFLEDTLQVISNVFPAAKNGFGCLAFTTSTESGMKNQKQVRTIKTGCSGCASKSKLSKKQQFICNLPHRSTGENLKTEKENHVSESRLKTSTQEEAD